MFLKQFVKFVDKEFPNDCLICAIRPTLNFMKLNIFNADHYCYHGKISSNPHFKASKKFQLLSILFTVFLTIGIVKDIMKFNEELIAADLLTMIRLCNSICTVYCQARYNITTKARIKGYNAMLSIINHRKSFGLKSILSKSDTKKINKRMFKFVLLAFGLLFVNCLPLLALDNLSVDLLMNIATSELSSFAFTCALMLVSENFETFTTLFQRCITQIEIYLSESDCRCHFEEELYRKRTTKLKQIQAVQRLYMAIWRSFKYCEVMFPTDIMLMYIFNSIVLVLLEGYVIVLYLRDKLYLKIWYWQILWKSFLIIFGFTLCSIQTHRIRLLVDDRLPFLFKIPISKLNRTEATQVEMFIKMIVEQKPELKASEMYTWGPTVVLSTLATGITYMLVALQFRLFW